MRAARHGRHVLQPADRRLAVGPLAQGHRRSSPPSRASRLPERFDLSLPANQRKLDAVEQLAQLADEAGITLIQLAIAFVLNHPAITAALIGPRTMEQLEASSPPPTSSLTRRVLDRIDEIVAPGITINPADNSFINPALEPAARRRPAQSDAQLLAR